MSIEYAVDHQLSLDHLSLGLYISARTMDRVLFLRRQLAMFRERKPERTTPRDLDRWLMACLLSSKTSVTN